MSQHAPLTQIFAVICSYTLKLLGRCKKFVNVPDQNKVTASMPSPRRPLHSLNCARTLLSTYKYCMVGITCQQTSWFLRAYVPDDSCHLSVPAFSTCGSLIALPSLPLPRRPWFKWANRHLAQQAQPPPTSVVEAPTSHSCLAHLQPWLLP